ncbi:serine hydrolase domain-containing protein [Acidobacteriota bacterium]
MKKKHSLYKLVAAVFGLVIFCTLTPDCLSSQSKRKIEISNPFASLYQTILEEFRLAGHPGVGAFIRTREEGIWNGTAGFSRLEDRTPIRPESLFNTLSSAKAYIAAAVLLLWEEGWIDLDAKIDLYLPEEICDKIPNGRTATVHQLLAHTSGIPDSDEKAPDIELLNDPYSWTWQDILAGVYGLQPLFAPGTNLEYRSTNFMLLAYIIDELTGSHANFLTTRIFQPLGLVDTYYKLEANLPCPPDLVDIYYDRYGDGNLENATDVLCALYYNSHYGSSGISATLEDCGRFMENLMDGNIIGPDALAIMTSPSFPGYEWRGLGIGVIDWIDGQGVAHRFYEMAGSGAEGMSQTRYFPLEGITISIATNVGSANRPRAHENFFKLLTDLTSAVFDGRGIQTVPGEKKIRNRNKSFKK